MAARKPKKTPSARPDSIRHLPLAERLKILAELLEEKHRQLLEQTGQAAAADDEQPATAAELAQLRSLWGDDGEESE